MRKQKVAKYIIFVIFMLASSSAISQQRFQFDTEAQRQTYLVLIAELRCPKCQNQNIADSNAMISEDMKRKVYELVIAGHSEAEVIDYMKQRYGEFVHYQPPITPVTIWLYLLPVIFIGLMIIVVLNSKAGKRKATDQASVAKAEQALKDLK